MDSIIFEYVSIANPMILFRWIIISYGYSLLNSDPIIPKINWITLINIVESIFFLNLKSYEYKNFKEIITRSRILIFESQVSTYKDENTKIKWNEV